jgi:AraC-like DNA-binding protein
MSPLSVKTKTPAKIAESMLDKEPAREVIPPHPSLSFRWLEHDYPSEIAKWQYHPEFEIHLIRKSTGSFIAGDYIGPFEPGQVSLMGSNLPHDWMSDIKPGEFFENRDVVIQFDWDWIERCIAAIPEFAGVRKILQESSRGIVFTGKTRERAEVLIERMAKATDFGRVRYLLELLELFASSPKKEKVFLAQEIFKTDSSSEGRLAVESGIAYIFKNMTKEIRMSEAAKLAHMSEPTFSKYFKKASGFTFSDMVKKLRIAHSCRLLDQTKDSVAEICENVGYTNLANFNRQFLAEVGMTPTAYRKLPLDKKPALQLLSLGLKATVDGKPVE